MFLVIRMGQQILNTLDNDTLDMIHIKFHRCIVFDKLLPRCNNVSELFGFLMLKLFIVL